MLFLFIFIQCIFVSSLMKLSPNKITQAEGVTQKKINALVGGQGGAESSWRKPSYRIGMGK